MPIDWNTKFLRSSDSILPINRVLKPHDPHPLSDLILLLPHHEHEQVGDELRQRHHHVHGHDDPEDDKPVARVLPLRELPEVHVRGEDARVCVRLRNIYIYVWGFRSSNIH